MKVFLGLIALAALLFFGAGPKMVDERINRVSDHAPYVISEDAKNLHANLFIGDWHADSTLWDRNLSDRHTCILTQF